MDTKNTCRLCLVSKNDLIDFFDDEAINLNITKIVVQHFWFQIHRNDNLPIGICRICWKYVNDFHEFYENIEIIHKNHYDNLQFQNDLKISNIKSEITECNSSSLNCSNIEFVEPIVEIKIEDTKVEVGKPKRSSCKSTANNILKSLTKPATIKINRTKIKRKITSTNNLKKIILNNKLVQEIKKSESIMAKDEQQFIEENCVRVNEIINDDINAIKDECYHLNNDKDFTDEIQISEKLHNNAIINAENIQIREFYNLKCDICSSQHSTMFELKNHYRNAHNSKNGYVLCCNKKLFKRCKLLEHMLWHINPDEFRCKFCKQIYANKSGLKMHMQCHSTAKERKFICDICDTNFILKYHLMRHFQKIHLTQANRTFKCNQCDKGFKKNSILQNHIRGVHEQKNLNICPICAKVYKSKQQCEIHYLDEHLNVNKPKLKCHLCNAILKNETSLKCHMQRKHHEQPIACNLCGKIVLNKMALQNHRRNVHTERKHKCSLCDKGFKRPIGLREHMATHAGVSHLYTCPYCMKSFNSHANMHSHRKKKHPIEWLEDRHIRLGIVV